MGVGVGLTAIGAAVGCACICVAVVRCDDIGFDAEGVTTLLFDRFFHLASARNVAATPTSA